MKSTLRNEERLLSLIVLACYGLALGACGAGAYALTTLSAMAYGNALQGFYRAGTYF